MKSCSVVFASLTFVPAIALGQLPSELAALACKPVKDNAPDLIVEKSGRQWQLSVQADGAKKTILASAVPVSNAQRASEAGYVVYFLANEKYPKQSGFEAQLSPIAACVTPDGHKLAYVTQTLAAVQVDLLPAIERFRYFDDPAPKDHVLVPAPSGG